MELPVSGMEVRFRAPNGGDDMAILEAGGKAAERALTVLPRLAWMVEPAGEGDRAPWAGLTVTDFEVALLGLQQFLFGDKVAFVFRCTSGQCGERMEPEMSIAALLAEVRPSTPPRVKPSEDHPGWFTLEEAPDGDVRFRLPIVEDQVKVMGRPQARKLLAQRCIAADGFHPRELARVERAMEAMAPLVSRTLEGNCAECGERVDMPLHVPEMVMDELCAVAAGVHDEIDAIAETYHWDESTILAMPQSRRRAYAETIRRHQRAAL